MAQPRRTVPKTTSNATVPASVLDTVGSALVARHALPKVLAGVTTPLVWRTREHTPAVVALRELVRGMSAEGKSHSRGVRVSLAARRRDA